MEDIDFVEELAFQRFLGEKWEDRWEYPFNQEDFYRNRWNTYLPHKQARYYDEVTSFLLKYNTIQIAPEPKEMRVVNA